MTLANELTREAQVNCQQRLVQHQRPDSSRSVKEQQQQRRRVEPLLLPLPPVLLLVERR